MTWTLAIDESGTFQESKDDGDVLVGLLVRGQWGQGWEPWVRELRSRMPSVPWPPHAAHEAADVALRAVAAHHPDIKPVAGFAHALGTLAARVVDHPNAAVRAAVDAMRRRRSIKDSPLATLSALDAWLAAQEPEAHELIRTLSSLEREGLAAAISTLGDEADATLIVVRARPPEDHPEPETLARGGLARTRYVTAFETMIERVVSLIDEPNGRVDLEIVAENRTLRALQRDVPVSPLAVAAITQGALGRRRTSVLVGARKTWTRDDGHPLLVLVDHLARRVRYALRPGGSLASVSGRLARGGACGLAAMPIAVTRAPAWHHRALPALAADGVARAWIRLAPGASPDGPVPAPAWNLEQAELWREAVGAR